MSFACPSCHAVFAPRPLKPGKYRPKCVKCSEPFTLVVQWVVAGGEVPDGPTIPTPPKADPKPAPVRATTDREDIGNVTGDFSEPSPDATGLPTSGSHDPSATGEFTEPDRFNPAAKQADPHTTGEFTETNGISRSPDATGDFTETDEHRTLTPPAKAKKRATETADESDDTAPPRLGGYEVLKVLGKGGMGAVLLGRQISLDRKVALKVMHPRVAENPAFVARFTREAYAAAQLAHHNVVPVYDIGEDRGQHFFSMEFVTGGSLMDLVKKEGKLAPAVAVGYVLQAARGLRYGHNQGMVHRDIKPDNLMVNDEGVVKVADLGLVKLPSGDLSEQAGSIPDADGDSVTELTRAGTVMGTPAYMAPEQAKDSGKVDQRADVYSLGCTLYVLVTGRPPFEGKTALEIISKHQTQPIVPPEAVVKRVPKALSGILLKMLAKKPEDRYQTMDEVIAALEGFLGVERGGPFNPSEDQADQLEKAVCQFNVRSKGRLKGLLAGGFFAACAAGVVGSAVAGMPTLAGGLVGLMVMAPLAYFVVHGTLTGSVVFTKARGLVFGMRFFDWLMWAGGGVLFLATLFLFGLLWSWLGFAALAVGLAFVLWFLTDRPQAKGQRPPLEDARVLFRNMRLKGLDEEAVRRFACQFAGPNWEPFYEALFGYEAKLAARAYRKGDTGEPSRKAGTWREPVIGWIEGRMDARRLAKERKLLQKVEAKALEAEGASKAEAKAQAAAMAADLVDQAAEATKARKEGKEVSVRAMVAAARERRRPKPGYNLAGVKLKNLWFRDFLTDWLGRRLRFLLGAVVFAAGLLWMQQNHLLQNNRLVAAGAAFDFATMLQELGGASAKPLAVSFLPPEVTQPVNAYTVPLTGLLLMLSGMFYFGWRPTLAAVPGAAVALLGPQLGVPDAGPLNAQVLSFLIGAVLIVGVGWFLRK